MANSRDIFPSSWFSRRFQWWMDKRTPVSEELQLNRKRLYILPSAAGFFFLLVVILIWLMGINYQNNLILSLCFLLLALFISGIHFSHNNLSGITLRAVRGTSVFAGQTAAVELCISQSGKRFRDNIELQFPQGDPLTVSISESGDSFVTLLVPTRTRGMLNPGRLIITSYYPLGLFRVWSYARFRLDAVVYPSPVEAPMMEPGNAGKGEGQYRGVSGSDDYAGLREYRQGEPLRHIAWKHFARDQGLWTKQFADPVDQRLWVDWEAFPGLDREQRLRRMCWQVCQLADQQVLFGLRLPGIEIPPDSGLDHRNRLLRQLALFELTPDTTHRGKGS